MDPMDIIKDNDTLTTDKSSKSSPSTQTSPTALPPPSTTPPPLPPVPTPLNPTVADRQSLQPVPPSKRVLTEAPQIAGGESTENAYTFLPRELSDVIAIRQRRERAWHARLMICTSAISCVEGFLASFQDGIEKEEAGIFLAYFHQVVSKFAACDASPPPPPIPTHSRPKKGGFTFNSKLPNKPVVVATPKVIPTPSTRHEPVQKTATSAHIMTAEPSWTTVARNGPKKSRVIKEYNNNPTQEESEKRPAHQHKSQRQQKIVHQQTPDNKSSKSGCTDKRVFLRLPHDHEWRKLSPAGIREVVVKNLSVSPVSFGRVKPVRSGFALSPSNEKWRDEILKAGNGLFLTGAKIEPATTWEPVIIPTVPFSIRTLAGITEVTKEILSDEIERVSKVRPVSLKLYGHNNSAAPHRTWMAYFTKAPRATFRVFDESGIGRSFKKPQPLEFCKRCNGHHASKNCSRAPSCGNCGSTMHAENACLASTKCKNCGGPHRADSRRCLARPTRAGAPTREQLKIYRQAGEREFQALARAREAEQKTKEMEGNANATIKILPTDIVLSEPIASSVEVPTDDAMRL